MIKEWPTTNCWVKNVRKLRYQPRTRCVSSGIILRLFFFSLHKIFVYRPSNSGKTYLVRHFLANFKNLTASQRLSKVVLLILHPQQKLYEEITDSLKLQYPSVQIEIHTKYDPSIFDASNWAEEDLLISEDRRTDKIILIDDQVRRRYRRRNLHKRNYIIDVLFRPVLRNIFERNSSSQ